MALASRPELSDPTTAKALSTCGAAVLDALEEGVRQHQLTDRFLPLERAGRVEEELARACYAAALFEEVIRCPDPRRSHLLQTAHSGLTPAGLLASVPAHAVADLTAMTTLAGEGMAAVRRRVAADQIVLAPTFAGSEDVGGADGDWLADGLLVDVKATIHPGKLPLTDVYQLAGYLLLDYHDEHRISEVGWYSARLGALISFSCEEFVHLLGAQRSLPALRQAMYRLWHPSAPPARPSRPAARPAQPSGAPAGPTRPGRAPVQTDSGREHGLVITAVQDAGGQWHGQRAGEDRHWTRATLPHHPAPAEPGALSPFTGQNLTVEIVSAEAGVDLAPALYRLDDGRLLPATWQVHELLDDPFPGPLPPASVTTPVPGPGIRLEATHGDRRYCLAADPVGADRLEVTVLVCSTDGIIHGELTGEMDAGDLARIGRLITAVADACPAPAAAATAVRQGPPDEGANAVKATRPGAAWTPQQEQHLRQGHHAGQSAAELARELGRSESAIRWKLYALKLGPYPDDLVPSPRPAPEPVPPKAYTATEKRQTHPRAYERWTPEEDARLGELHARGLSVEQMAQELGRNEGAISARLGRILPPF
ncbi:hypothetical protein [Streptomyces sp. NPDC048581]|uniref:hypothetical protein n=1 Tax=unclassified Streptomyces TaxID=2593676 RepID=UPI00371E34D1